MIIHLKGSPREMTLSSPIYIQCQCKNASEKTPFHEQNMPEPFQEQSTDPSNRGANKDHRTNLIPIPSINHPTSFPINYKNDSNIMVEREGSIVYQQIVKNTKLKNKIIIIKQIISLEANKLIRTIESSIQQTKFYNLNKSCDKKEILNKRIQKEDHYRIK